MSFAVRRHAGDAAALCAPRPGLPAAVGAAVVRAVGHGVCRQHREGLPHPGRPRGTRGLHHGRPGPARALRAGLQRQPRCGRHLEGGDVPRADRGGRHPHGHPAHPRRRGDGPHRAGRLDRGGPLRRPERGAAAVVRGVVGHRRDRRGRLLATTVPAGGSLAFGAALASSGVVFTAVAAVAAQLSSSAQFSRGAAFAVLAASSGRMPATTGGCCYCI